MIFYFNEWIWFVAALVIVSSASSAFSKAPNGQNPPNLRNVKKILMELSGRKTTQRLQDYSSFSEYIEEKRNRDVDLKKEVFSLAQQFYLDEFLIILHPWLETESKLMGLDLDKVTQLSSSTSHDSKVYEALEKEQKKMAPHLLKLVNLKEFYEHKEINQVFSGLGINLSEEPDQLILDLKMKRKEIAGLKMQELRQCGIYFKREIARLIRGELKSYERIIINQISKVQDEVTKHMAMLSVVDTMRISSEKPISLHPKYFSQTKEFIEGAKRIFSSVLQKYLLYGEILEIFIIEDPFTLGFLRDIDLCSKFVDIWIEYSLTGLAISAKMNGLISSSSLKTDPAIGQKIISFYSFFESSLEDLYRDFLTILKTTFDSNLGMYRCYECANIVSPAGYFSQKYDNSDIFVKDILIDVASIIESETEQPEESVAKLFEYADKLVCFLKQMISNIRSEIPTDFRGKYLPAVTMPGDDSKPEFKSSNYDGESKCKYCQSLIYSNSDGIETAVKASESKPADAGIKSLDEGCLPLEIVCLCGDKVTDSKESDRKSPISVSEFHLGDIKRELDLGDLELELDLGDLRRELSIILDDMNTPECADP